MAAALALAACGGGASSSAPESSAAAGADAVKTISAVARSALAGNVPDGASGPLLSTQRDAVRLSDQATFGPTEALLASIRQTGVEAWIAGQMVATGARYTSGGSDLIHKPDRDDFCLRRPERLRVFRSCPLIRPKVARSSLQMRAIARAMAVLCA